MKQAKNTSTYTPYSEMAANLGRARGQTWNRGSLSSNINCCVPLCNQRGTVDPNKKIVGFFNFPKDPNLRAQWLQKIRRDVGTKFKLTEITKVCSLHFRESEIKKGLGGKRTSLDITAVPSKFAWRTSPRKRPPPSALIFFPPRPFLISLSRKCSEQTFVISISLNFVPTSLRIFCSH